jgi:hypothetical protein
LPVLVGDRVRVNEANRLVDRHASAFGHLGNGDADARRDSIAFGFQVLDLHEIATVGELGKKSFS